MSNTENIAQALIPLISEDSKKSRYIGYRVAGFAYREAIAMAKTSERAIKRWREQDPEFAKLDLEGLTELRKQLSNEIINLEFTRNFHLILKKDFGILFKDARGTTLTDREYQYLVNIRKHYTPQHLAIIKQLVGEVERGEDFDFTKLTLTIRREREELIVTKG